MAPTDMGDDIAEALQLMNPDAGTDMLESQVQSDGDGMGPAVLGMEGKWVGAQKWNYVDVQEWLDHLKLHKYREKFFEWGIDGRILMEMKKEVGGYLTCDACSMRVGGNPGFSADREPAGLRASRHS